MRIFKAVLVVLALATIVHLDWHAARPLHHHLSLGLSWHWLAAVPVFALTALYVHRAWPERPIAASAWIIAAGAVLGGVLEPGYEFWIAGASFDWAWGPLRTMAFVCFTATGIVAHAIVLTWVRRPPRSALAAG